MVAGEAVEDKAPVTVVVPEPLIQKLHDQLVRNQLPGIHRRFCLQPQRRAGRHGGAQQVAGGHLGPAFPFLEPARLRALPRARGAQKNNPHRVLRPGLGSGQRSAIVHGRPRKKPTVRMPAPNALYAQSGGPTAVINATAQGVIEAVRWARPAVGKLYAARNGILGALNEQLLDTDAASAETVTALGQRPGSAFGTARYKLARFEDDEREYQRLIDVFRAHDIGMVFFNGGNDSMDTALKLSELGRRLDYPLTCIGLPKTVDNDLPVTDCCPGFGSAAKYVAVSTREAALDVAGMARTSTKVFILEVMGRHAGWIAAAGGLAGSGAGDAPHIILFPEVPFEADRFLERVRESVERREYCVIVASEGARYADGRFLSEAGGTDAFGHKQLGGLAPVLANMIRESLGYKHHYAIS